MNATYNAILSCLSLVNEVSAVANRLQTGCIIAWRLMTLVESSVPAEEVGLYRQVEGWGRRVCGVMDQFLEGTRNGCRGGGRQWPNSLDGATLEWCRNIPGLIRTWRGKPYGKLYRAFYVAERLKTTVSWSQVRSGLHCLHKMGGPAEADVGLLTLWLIQWSSGQSRKGPESLQSCTIQAIGSLLSYLPVL